MGACCSNREPRPTITSLGLVYCKSKLSRSSERLTQQHQTLQKLNLHLNYFQQRANDFRTLLRDLKKAKKDYVEQHSKLAESVDLMNALLSQLEMEVQAQYVSERESTDLSKEELFAVVQAVRAQKQAERLELLSSNIQTLISYPTRRKEFDERVEKSRAALKQTVTSLLGYVRFVEDAKKEVQNAVEDMDEVTEMKGNEKWEESVREWTITKRGVTKLGDDLDNFSKKLISAFLKFEADLVSLHSEMDAYLESVPHTEKATKVQSAAQPYLSHLSTERASIPRRSHHNSSGSISPLIQTSQSGSIYMEEFTGSLRRLCILNHYRDGAILSPNETYNTMLDLLLSKATADRLAIESQTCPLSLELFLLTHFTKGGVDKAVAVTSVMKFTGGLDQLSTYPIASLMLEMVKFLEKDAMSIHEEVFVTKAFALLEDCTNSGLIDIDTRWKTGGLLKVSQAIPLIEEWFREDKETGEKVIAGLLPDVNPINFTIYYVLFRLIEYEKTPEELFYLLDKRKANNVQRDDFIEGVKSHLNIMLPDSYLEAVSEKLDKTASNGIFRTEFNRIFEISKYDEAESSEQFTISRMAVISSLRAAYAEWKSELSSHLYMEFILVPVNNYRVSISDSEALVSSVDPELTAEQVNAFTARLKNIAGDNFGFEAFRDCVIQFPIGKWAKSFFCKEYAAVTGLAWTEDKVKISEYLISLLKGKKSLNEFGGNAGK